MTSEEQNAWRKLRRYLGSGSTPARLAAADAVRALTKTFPESDEPHGVMWAIEQMREGKWVTRRAWNYSRLDVCIEGDSWGWRNGNGRLDGDGLDPEDINAEDWRPAEEQDP